MAPCRLGPPRKTVRTLAFAFLVTGLTAFTARPACADDKPAVLDKPAPESVDDLRAIQKQVKTVLTKVMPCIVGVKIGQAQGSGVIVNKDGFVLTAGHVSGEAGRECTLIFADGKTVKGKTLGSNRGIDSGLIQITEEGNWPFVEMGKSGDTKRGQWCIAVGQPGGYRAGRTPPVRLGRILDHNSGLIRTDCTLVGGDSGGPLFDMDGKVIGIHSRIGNTLATNIHVPVDTYRDTWDRLAKAEVWGGRAGPGGPYMGVQGDPDADQCKITGVVEGSPAEKAGVKVGDVITKFGDQKIDAFEQLVEAVRKKKVGDEVSIVVQRGEETIKLKLNLVKRPD